MKKIFSVLFLCCVAFCAQAETFEYDFSSEIPFDWLYEEEPLGYEGGGEKRGAQWTTSANLYLYGVMGLTKVQIVASSNIAGKNSMSVYVDDESLGSYTFAKENHVTKTFTTEAVDGDLLIALTRNEKSIWIEKIIVTADSVTGFGFGFDDDEVSYAYEDSDAVNLNLTFTTAEYVDFGQLIDTMQYVMMYLDNDDYELYLCVFAQGDSSTIIKPGTYPIDNSYEKGTVMASVGGDSEEDYPTCLFSDFGEEDGETYYGSVHYIVSGTMTVAADAAGVKITIDAKSYYGSTIKGTFVGKGKDFTEEYRDQFDPIEEVVAEAPAKQHGKQLRNGRLEIVRNGVRHSLEGIRIK